MFEQAILSVLVNKNISGYLRDCIHNIYINFVFSYCHFVGH